MSKETENYIVFSPEHAKALFPDRPNLCRAIAEMIASSMGAVLARVTKGDGRGAYVVEPIENARDVIVWRIRQPEDGF